ncbi:MAG: 6,7-dimethyl-8-ribityllumazine synthase, partial [Pseudomonadota bacterium]
MKPPPLTPPVFDVPTRVLIVVSPYYQDIAAQLLSGAEAALSAAARAMYERAEVPGALNVAHAGQQTSQIRAIARAATFRVALVAFRSNQLFNLLLQEV